MGKAGGIMTEGAKPVHHRYGGSESRAPAAGGVGYRQWGGKGKAARSGKVKCVQVGDGGTVAAARGR